jgi:heme/copper-type cytochrome/quinol oxidase subunit 2
MTNDQWKESFIMIAWIMSLGLVTIVIVVATDAIAKYIRRNKK